MSCAPVDMSCMVLSTSLYDVEPHAAQEWQLGALQPLHGACLIQVGDLCLKLLKNTAADAHSSGAGSWQVLGPRLMPATPF